MSTSTFALETPGISAIGTVIDGTLPWGSRRVRCAGIYTWINTVITGTDCFLPSYYVNGANDIVVTISNLDGSEASTTTLASSAGAYQHNVDLPIFTGRGSGSDVQTRVQIRFIGGGNDLLDADALLKVSAVGTPSLSLPTNYGTAVSLGNAAPYIGIEGGATTVTINGYDTIKSSIGGYNVNSTKVRFKAACETISILVYHNNTSWHLNRLNADGNSGIPLDAGQSVVDTGTSQFENWLTLATGLDGSNEYLYEITGANQGSTLVVAIMTSGGTGINVGASGLVRPLRIVGLGDSRMAGLLGTNGVLPGRVDLGVMERISQHFNCQVVNGGINGSKITDWNAGGYWNILMHLPAGSPVGVIFDFGINDVFAGESVADLTTAYTTALTTARSVVPGVTFLVEGIKPTTFGGQTFSSLHLFNAGNGLPGSGIKGVVDTLTASGDTHMIYADTESWQLAGAAWNVGGSFDTTNFISDQLHENPVGQAVEAAYLYTLLSRLLDITSPTIPLGLVQNLGAFVAVTVTWMAATDAENTSNKLRYRIYRDGTHIATTEAGITSFTETAPGDGSVHAYKVQTEDPSGNLSDFSSPLSILWSLPASSVGGNRLSIGLS